MIVIKGRKRRVIGTDGTPRYESKPDMTFHTAMGALHWLLQAGAFRSLAGKHRPKTPDMAWLGRDGQGPGMDGQVIDSFFQWEVTSTHLSALRRAQERYAGRLRYLREVEPQWREVRTVSYADNSEERIEVNRYGTQRRVMVTAPHGDVC